MLQRVAEGRLAGIAPTLLELMGLPKPKEMTGASLLRGDGDYVGRLSAGF